MLRHMGYACRRHTERGGRAPLEGSILEVELTFHAGSAYCCYEWGCHIAFTPLAKRWDDLRRQLVDRAILLPARIELRRTIVIEEGAMFFDLRSPDPRVCGWYAFAPVSAHRYHWVSIEVPGQEHESSVGGTKTCTEFTRNVQRTSYAFFD
jgi:hypothetical protein